VSRLARGALLALLSASACTLVHQRAEDRPMQGQASGQKGMLQYGVGRLTFVAPDGWEARGGERRVQLSHPDNQGKLDVQQVDRAFQDHKDCLANGDEALAKGVANLTNVRRHSSTFAGRRAISQEADQAGWHGWAWAVCDGGTQYRIFFAGRSPVPKDVIEAWRAFTKSALVAEGK
jgi:hypothetical protein